MGYAITGCVSGSFWTCSLMGSRLAIYMGNAEIRKEFQLILRSFIYAPVSGRCLITITVVGIILAEVAAAYNEVLDSMDRGLERTVVSGFSLLHRTAQLTFCRTKTSFLKVLSTVDTT